MFLAYIPTIGYGSQFEYHAVNQKGIYGQVPPLKISNVIKSDLILYIFIDFYLNSSLQEIKKSIISQF